MNLTATKTAAVLGSLLTAGLLSAAPAGAASTDLGVQDNAPVVTCAAKILQGEGWQTCTVEDKQGVASVKVTQVNGTSFVKAFGGCAKSVVVKNYIASQGDQVKNLTVTDCKGFVKTVSPVLPG
jgi:hypothetical protein